VPSSSIHRIQEAQTTIYQVFWELTSTAVSKASGAEGVGSTQEVSHVPGHTG
jgi:D-sedoheptulose 7-phosphate isomerase